MSESLPTQEALLKTREDSKKNLENQLANLLHTAEKVGNHLSNEWQKAIARIPNLPLDPEAFKDLRNTDPELARIIELQNNRTLNEIGETLEAIKQETHIEPNGYHSEKLRELYTELKRLQNTLPLTEMNNFNREILAQSTNPTIELARLENTNRLQKPLKAFIEANFSVISQFLPTFVASQIEDFARGFATGLINTGADISEFISMMTNHPQEFLKSFQLAFEYLRRQGFTKTIGKAYEYAVDETADFIDSSIASNGSHLAFDLGHGMSHCLTFVLPTTAVKITVSSFKVTSKLAPQLTDPLAPLYEQNTYTKLTIGLCKAYNGLSSLIAQKLIANIITGLSLYKKIDQVELVNTFIEAFLNHTVKSLLRDKNVLRCIVDAGFNLINGEKDNFLKELVSKHLPAGNQFLQLTQNYSPSKEEVYQILGITT